MKKVFLTIGAVVIFALAGVFWYLQKSEKDETKTVSVVNNVKNTVTQEAQKEVRNEKTSEVLTEKDGSDTIDTSDWKEYKVGIVKTIYPKGWHSYDYHTISNKHYEDILPKDLDVGEVRISFSGAYLKASPGINVTDPKYLVDRLRGSISEKSDENLVCKILFHLKDIVFGKCEDDYKIAYLKIEKNNGNYSEDIVTIRFYDKKAISENIDVIRIILDNYYLQNEKFIPKNKTMQIP